MATITKPISLNAINAEVSSVDSGSLVTLSGNATSGSDPADGAPFGMLEFNNYSHFNGPLGTMSMSDAFRRNSKGTNDVVQTNTSSIGNAYAVEKNGNQTQNLTLSITEVHVLIRTLQPSSGSYSLAFSFSGDTSNDNNVISSASGSNSSLPLNGASSGFNVIDGITTSQISGLQLNMVSSHSTAGGGFGQVALISYLSQTPNYKTGSGSGLYFAANSFQNIGFPGNVGGSIHYGYTFSVVHRGECRSHSLTTTQVITPTLRKSGHDDQIVCKMSGTNYGHDNWSGLCP